MGQKLFTKNFTFLVLGQASSLFGNYILRLALSMYVLEISGSAAVFAGILSMAVVPSILLSPLGGILADRANRRNVMVALDALSGMFVLCAAVFWDRENAIAITYVLLVALSVLGAFETPTVHACIPQMLSGDNITRGNAAVNQVASISYLIAPMLGGVFYAAVGIKPVMYASVACFFATALLECRIILNQNGRMSHGKVFTIIKDDFFSSVRFLFRERTDIMKILLLAALARFFVMGVTLVGLPFLVREVLGLDAKFYGGAESALAVATIFGSAAAGALAGKLKSDRLDIPLCLIGACIIPAGLFFLVPAGAMARYAALVISFCGMQAAISVFSIFAVSIIQQNTPDHMIGKVMAYTSAITMCAQPAGQMAYGILFDRFRSDVSFALLPTGGVIFLIGLLALRFLK